MPTRWSLVPLLSLVALLSVGRPCVTHAQAAGRPPTADSAAIPRELVLALLGNHWGDRERRPEVVVGRLPEDFPPDAAPAGAVVVLGGVRYRLAGVPARVGQSTTVVTVPQAPAAALAAYEAQLRRAGWREEEGPGSGGGFVPSRAGYPVTLCRDSTFLVASTASRRAGESYLRIELARGERATPCDREASRVSRRPWMWDDVPMPALRAPDGAASRGGGGRHGGPDESESHTRLEVGVPPSAIVAHYAAQLREAGWTLGTPLAGAGVAVQTAQYRDAQGRSWLGLLAATILPGTSERDVLFRMMRLDAPGR